MSYTVKTAVKKLRQIWEESPTKGGDSRLKEIIDALEDKTMLLIEWGEENIQNVAREKLSFMENCDIEEIIENPLSKEEIIEVIEFLERTHDCNYGIIWEHVSCALDNISLPDSELCRVKI